MPSVPKISEAEDKRLIALTLVSAMDWFHRAVEQNMLALDGEVATRAQTMVLIWVSAGEHRANRLARKLGVSRQAVHNLINQLVERKILKVRPDPDHRRAVIVEFAPEEVAHHNRIASLVRKLEDVLAERLGKNKIDTLREVLAADWGDIPDLSSDPSLRRRGRPSRQRTSTRTRSGERVAGKIARKKRAAK